VRHFRVPLVAGAIVLLAITVAVAPDFPTRENAHGVLATAIDLFVGFSPVAQGVVVTSAAYIVGIVVQTLVPTSALARALMVRAYVFDVYPWPCGPSSVHKLREWLTDELRAGISTIETASGSRIDALVATPEELAHGPLHCLIDDEIPQPMRPARAEEYSPTDPVIVRLLTDLIRSLRGEESLTRRKLMGAEPEWYAEIDRLRAESDFRITVAVPLLALGVVCGLAERAYDADLSAIIGVVAIVIACVLLGQGYKLARDAGDALNEAIVVGRVTPPCVDRFRRETQWLADHLAAPLAVHPRPVQTRRVGTSDPRVHPNNLDQIRLDRFGNEA
jgi:hypothetical protein